MHAIEAAADNRRRLTAALTLLAARPAPSIYRLAEAVAGAAALAHGHVVVAAGEAAIIAALAWLLAGRIARQSARRTADVSGVAAGLADMRAVAEEALVVTAAEDAIRTARLIGASRGEALGE